MYKLIVEIYKLEGRCRTERFSSLKGGATLENWPFYSLKLSLPGIVCYTNHHFRVRSAEVACSQLRIVPL